MKQALLSKRGRLMFQAPKPQIEAKVYARDRAKLSEQPPVASGFVLFCQLHAAIIGGSASEMQVLVRGEGAQLGQLRSSFTAMKM